MSRTPHARPILPADASRAKRAELAIQLRIAGLSESQIAQRVGMSQSGVSRLIKQALQRQRQQSAETLRAVEGARVEELHRALWPQALKGNLGAANVVLKAADRRARLFGLDEGSEGGAGGAPLHLTLLIGISREALEEADAQSVADTVDAVVADTVRQVAARRPLAAVSAPWVITLPQDVLDAI